MSQIIDKQQSINSFLNRTDLSPTEVVVAQRLKNVDATIKVVKEEKEKLQAALDQKTNDLNNLIGQKDGLIEVAFSMELIIAGREAAKEPKKDT